MTTDTERPESSLTERPDGSRGRFVNWIVFAMTSAIGGVGIAVDDGKFFPAVIVCGLLLMFVVAWRAERRHGIGSLGGYSMEDLAKSRTARLDRLETRLLIAALGLIGGAIAMTSWLVLTGS